MTAEVFWNSVIVQYVTIAVSFLPLFLARRCWKDFQNRRSFTDTQLRDFKKLCSEAVVLYLLAFGFPIAFVLVQTISGSQQLTSNLANGYISSVGLAGLASFWNVYKGFRDTKVAKKQPSNVPRLMRLANVEMTNLRAYTFALLSVIGSLVGLILYNGLQEPPAYAWFVAYLASAIATVGLTWSAAVSTVAAAYEANPKLGRTSQRRKGDGIS